MSSLPRVLLLGYGNPGRQDDGLGPAAVAEIERLGWTNVTVQDNYQLALEDAIAVAEHDQVWFVDATMQGEGCEVTPLAPAPEIAFTSHRLSPECLLAIAAQQFGAAPEAWMLAIRGYAFEFTEGLSPRARANFAAAVAVLRARIPHPGVAP